MEFQIIETTLKDLSDEQCAILRKMTLIGSGEETGSEMQHALDSHAQKTDIPCIIAVDPRKSSEESYLGWSLVINYWRNDQKFVQVFVKPEHRQNGIGRCLVNHFRDRYQTLGLPARDKLFCFRWNGTSGAFYNSLNMVDVFLIQV
ncbi:MAG TPA: GNAT family N-acetyltransferase [Anaerovoracaceae bacterium]|nr:GNAT family N-acetyltransferase [Anaerovoracaceae bacterium]